MNKILDFQKAKSALSRVEKIGQLFMPAAFINDTEAEKQRLEHLIKEHHIGGLCFFHSRASAATNYEGKKKVVRNESSYKTLQQLIHRYQKAAKYPLIMAIDAEWGLAMRIENTPQYPYAITLGALSDNENELIFEVGRNIAKDCRSAGIHWNLSPVVDINTNPHNPVIGYRSFGDNKDHVYKKARAYLAGMHSEGVLGSIKHFPGHGDTAVDSHLGLPVIEKPKTELLENELYPFQKLIDDGVDAVMVGHLSVPALTKHPNLPSSVNKDMINILLRQEMGFKGVVISDALNMHAVSKNYPEPGTLEWAAFDAGNDILCFSDHVKEGISAIANKADASEIDLRFKRVWQLKEKAFANTENHGPAELQNASGLNTLLAEASLTWFKGNAEILADFRKNNYLKASIGSPITTKGPVHRKENVNQLKKDASTQDHILLHIFPPQVKPMGAFGFLTEEIDLINNLLTSKKVVLYHFGNPFALKLFNVEASLATLIAYQDLPEFRSAAQRHFEGKIPAKGQMPAKIV